MHVEQFHYDLPQGLIANQPAAQRTDSRLLVLDREGALDHRRFSDIIDLIEPGDLLVMNNTQVIPARLFGNKETGGRVEILVERILGDQCVLAHVKASKSPKAGSKLLIEGGYEALVTGRQDDLFALQCMGETSVLNMLDKVGHVPLPPYIERADTELDKARYQTVYAEIPGAVAAPTAGLHFDDELLGKLKEKGVNIAFVTLHVGAGTFQSVHVETITEHQMHSEVIKVSQVVCDQVASTRAAGKKVIAVGTTSVRCLETAGRSGVMQPMQGETDIFIYPGYRFKMVDSLITNFHLPESTLLMLVCAFAGYNEIMAAYRVAVEAGYRFFSYGDAMFLHRNPQAANDQT